MKSSARKLTPRSAVFSVGKHTPITPVGRGLQRCSTGFTLLELMIAVAVVGILAAIALPSYEQYVLRSNRGIARSFVSDILARQESFYADRKRYAGSLKDLGYSTDTISIDREGQVATTEPIYDISIGTTDTVCLAAATAAPADPVSAYMVFAVPKARQKKDRHCATLCVASDGYRGASSKATDCWTR